jgi:tripartite ATP-independent transporter DctP family solute receptor
LINEVKRLTAVSPGDHCADLRQDQSIRRAKGVEAVQRFLVTLLALILTVPGLAQTLQFGHNAPVDSPTGQAAERFAEIVSEKTNGRLRIQVFPANQLGGNRELVEQTSLGALDISLSGLGVLGYLSDGYNLMQVPFLFRDQEHAHAIVEGVIGEEIAEKLRQQTGILLLSQTWDRLPRQVTANRPITTPGAMEGLLLRTGTAGATQGFRLFGARPTSIPLNEVYLALQQNVVEGVELPIDFIVNLSVPEVNTHLNMLNHTYGTQFVAINEMRFNSLPAEYQRILRDAVDEAGLYNNRLVEEQADMFLQAAVDQGMTVVEISEEQYQRFAQIIRANLKEIESRWPGSRGLGERILDTKTE